MVGLTNTTASYSLYLMQFLQLNTLLPPPKWSSNYVIEGDIFVPLANVQEPFQAWYDSESNNSRIDYHYGKTKTYQLPNKGPFGSSLKIIPASTETETNTLKCIEMNGSDNFQINPQLILPNLTNFKFFSKTREPYFEVEKWVFISEEEQTIKSYAMTLYRKDNVVYPLQFRVDKHNSEFQSDFDSYIIDYRRFSPDKPNPNIFNVDDLECESFSGPDEDYIFNFSPIMEYMNAYGKHVDVAFEKYRRLHNKRYTNGTKEHFKRKNYFRHNLRYIYSKNRANLSYKLSVNRFADYSDEELKSMHGYKKTIFSIHFGDIFPYDKNDFSDSDLPYSLDWRMAGAVTPVKFQSNCGSSWSFSTTGNIEGAFFMKYGQLKKFSEQALIDCSWIFGNNECEYGEDYRAYSWIKAHGLPTEEKYGPYHAQGGFCHEAGISNKDRAMISGFVKINENDDEALKIALVNEGPISVVISVESKSFYFYSSGIFDDNQCYKKPPHVYHAMLLVGYDFSSENAYWIVKNSWSTRWGEDGYIRISRDKNNCGVLTSPTYVILKDIP